MIRSPTANPEALATGIEVVLSGPVMVVVRAPGTFASTATTVQ